MLVYSVRALHHLLEFKNHGVPWPTTTLPTHHMLNYIIKRVNEASGPYQMFQELADIYIIDQ